MVRKKNLEKDSSGDFIIPSKDLQEEKEDTTTLKEIISQLHSDMEQLVSKLSV
jgi:hypothetical protein